MDEENDKIKPANDFQPEKRSGQLKQENDNSCGNDNEVREVDDKLIGDDLEIREAREVPQEKETGKKKSEENNY